ncbi:Alkylated DNA repair protein AlkB [Candidatus Phaeomarinobacter ectocarpi]|uniref:Alkylated DNA repair protein AlkB n=1 Tax=Candidatus Phaeomarinibacter ectocarpi TaxID=1458461 RepID=X5MLU8_9HYPH|nr:alpha-ketoglutarate-dependent dioxygenase AlkB [Candidatus Phaeomarinobacter ectocarpi]CDO59810.1 Alkylated DNA repair protein AlkB [Candidatus Phaeomarinobacter ectocarpi]
MTGFCNKLTPAPGVDLHSGALDTTAQRRLLDDIREITGQAPLYNPTMPRTGKPWTVRMTSCGPQGWVSDRSGYRYQPNHPETGNPWPAIPQMLLDLWDETTGYPAPPECCLVNFYADNARMGLHRDEDEEALDAPVLSISLGDTATFRLGGLERKGKTQSFKLHSGDVLLIGGDNRLAYHGIDRVFPNTSTLLKDGGRINLTLRRVTKP